MSRDDLFKAQEAVGHCAFDLGNWVDIIEEMIPDGTIVGGLYKVSKDGAIEKLRSIAKKLGQISNELREQL